MACGNDSIPEARKQRNLPRTAIPIWQEIGVTDPQMNAVLEYLSTIYQNTAWINNNKTNFEVYVDEIHVHSGNQLTKNGNVLMIGCNATQQNINIFMTDISNGLW